MKYLILYLLAVNLIAFITAGVDKRKAKKDKWRVRESTMFLLAAIGGGVGLYTGFLVFRHKTKKPRFMLGVPFIIAAQIFIAVKLL